MEASVFGIRNICIHTSHADSASGDNDVAAGFGAGRHMRIGDIRKPRRTRPLTRLQSTILFTCDLQVSCFCCPGFIKWQTYMTNYYRQP